MAQSMALGGRADIGSIAALYEAHASELGAFVWRGFRGRVNPDDIVHEAFARLVRETTAGREPALVRPWLYRVAHNLGVDELRRREHVEPERDDRPPTGATPSAESDYESASIDPELCQAMAALSSAGRRAIIMAAEGYCGREIADALGRSQIATRALLCRSRKLLRDALADSSIASDRTRPTGAAA